MTKMMMVTQEDADKAFALAMLELIKPVVGGGLVQLTARLVGAVVLDDFTSDILSRPDGFAFDFGTSDQVAAMFRSKGLHDVAEKLEAEQNTPGRIRCVIHVQGKTTFEELSFEELIRAADDKDGAAARLAHGLLDALGKRGIPHPLAS